MISKELFSEVMNIKIEDIVDLKIFGKELNYYEKCLLNFCCDGRLSKHKDSIYKSVNIYELAFKCKEWALSKGYIINSGATTSNDWSSTIYKVIKENPYIKELSYTWEQSENEAIFKACQWILDNKKEGN